MPKPPYTLIFAVLFGAWSLFATYKWLSVKRIEQMQCDTSKLEGERKALEDELNKVRLDLLNSHAEGTAAMRGNFNTYQPIRETVREIHVPAACDADFPPGVQRALDEAVAAANRVYPARN